MVIILGRNFELHFRQVRSLINFSVGLSIGVFSNTFGNFEILVSYQKLRVFLKDLGFNRTCICRVAGNKLFLNAQLIGKLLRKFD